MDQESKKFIEGAFEKWTGVIMGEFKRVDNRFDAVDVRFDRLEEDLSETKKTVAQMVEDMSETKAAVMRVEHSLQGKVEGQEDVILDLHRRMDRVENKVGLPHILSA
jgi:hypothetical protein